MAKQHILREGKYRRGLCGVQLTAANVGQSGNLCQRCWKIDQSRLAADRLHRRTMRAHADRLTAETGSPHLYSVRADRIIRAATVPAAPDGWQVQGKRGGSWVDVPAAWYGPDYRSMAENRADTLADLIDPSQFQVVNVATGTVVYRRNGQQVYEVIAVMSATVGGGAK